MNQFRRRRRILILSLLLLSVFAPIVFVSNRLKSITSVDRGEFIEEVSDIRYKPNDLRLTAIEQEEEGFKESKRILHDQELNPVVWSTSSDKPPDALQYIEGDKTTALSETGNNLQTNEERAVVSQQTTVSSNAGEELSAKDIQLNHKTEFRPPLAKSEKNTRVQLERATNEKVKEIRDKIIQAKAYLNLALPGNNSQIVKELRVRTKELERAVGDATKDKHLSKSSPQRLKAMELALFKVSRVFHNCPAIATKLHAMTYKSEEQARAQKKQAAHLMQLAARTTPKGLHCLSMRLTTEYFTLDHEKKELLQQSYNNPDLYHYVVFSDNVLACAVVVNSTISSAKDPGKIVFHVVTDSLNYPSISMWFILNPDSRATVQILNVDDMNVLPLDHAQLLMKQNSSDPRLISSLNHARFYLPDIFPGLNKIVLFDHDVVVQRDLSRLWSLDMKGKVVGAVETCLENEPSFHSMDTFINFSDAWVAQRLDPKACTWAFGMNLFDLAEWRRQDLTSVYLKYFDLGVKRNLWKAGSLPIGWLTFLGQMLPLEKRWNVVGLGHESGVKASDIEQAAVIHYDGIMKPWLDIGIDKYKRYWNIHVAYHHPYLQRCNIHD
ncbi:probable galacturonosyltransferase 5 [Eutrema salsugineum]|uniref:probable galacturonosyltransferase 5 n=1 Tax=Eutrema salsugineum TaxID=72664 RepID=UPI000CED34EA|nr:probable galacturonosyltransferase 5 [Eutrema salsugineum]